MTNDDKAAVKKAVDAIREMIDDGVRLDDHADLGTCRGCIHAKPYLLTPLALAENGDVVYGRSAVEHRCEKHDRVVGVKRNDERCVVYDVACNGYCEGDDA